MKRCSGCGEMKPLTAYSKNKKFKDGHQYQCKECQKRTKLPTRQLKPYLHQRPQWEKDVVREKLSVIVRVSEEHGPLTFEQVSDALDHLNARGVA